MVSLRKADPDVEKARLLLQAGAFAQARALLEQSRTAAREELTGRATELVEVLFLLEAAVAEADVSAGAKNRDALAVCEEAVHLLALSNVDAKTRIDALTRAATRSSVEGLSARSSDYLRHAIRTGEAVGLDIEVESLRENLLHGFLVREEIPAALAEAESWSAWPVDDIGLWLLVEAFFQSHRIECVPILERMLRNRSERDELSVGQMEQMIETARRWG